LLRARTALLLCGALLAAAVAAMAWIPPRWLPAAPETTASAVPARVVLRLSAAADAGAFTAQLERAGVADVALSPLAFGVAQTRIGFYHDADRAAAETVAALLRGADGATPPLRDYGGLVPAPPQGTLDIWIEGWGRNAR
jgi:hypothetical protein